MRPSRQNPVLFKETVQEIPEAAKQAQDKLGISRGSKAKNKRQLPYSTRFEYWRTTEGLSLGKIAARLEERTREFGMDAHYLLTRLMELENGRHKAPAWLMFLLVETYGIKFPWWEFWDGIQPNE